MTGTGAPLVSVVTPVYNTAPYLAQCIESVLAQSWPHWEFIVVDNCSTDGSREVAEQFTRDDPRVRLVIAERFRGQAANFNYALSFVSPASSYTKMVLSDDWIAPECLSEMVAVGEEHPSVGLIGAYMMWGSQVACQGLPYPTRMIDGRELGRRSFLKGPPVFGTPTSVMFRSEAIRKLESPFDENSRSIDTELCLRVLTTWDFGFVHKVLSYCRTENESITTSVLRFNPYPLYTLLLLRQHGCTFLGAAEYAECWRRLSREYFHYLGEALLRRQDPAFWAFHAKGLDLLGAPLTRWRRVRLATGALFDLVGNPKRTLERLADRRHRRALETDAGQEATAVFK
jgi:glycosyltransferase involved in cell wall biosynthesis